VNEEAKPRRGGHVVDWTMAIFMLAVWPPVIYFMTGSRSFAAGGALVLLGLIAGNLAESFTVWVTNKPVHSHRARRRRFGSIRAFIAGWKDRS